MLNIAQCYNNFINLSQSCFLIASSIISRGFSMLGTGRLEDIPQANLAYFTLNFMVAPAFGENFYIQGE